MQINFERRIAMDNSQTPENKVKRIMIHDIDFIVTMMNTIIPANEIDKNRLLIGESMLLQLKESLENAHTGAELSRIINVSAIREDWPILEQKLSDTEIDKELQLWKVDILKGKEK